MSTLSAVNMGGERTKSSECYDVPEWLFKCDTSSSGVVEAAGDYCSGVDDDCVPKSSISEDVLEKMQSRRVSEKTLNRGLFEKRIALQNEVLRECSKQSAAETLREMIKWYRPGDCIYKVGGISRGGFAIPRTTTLLIVGPEGAGKSCLINNMIRVLDNVTSGFDRAQTYVESGSGSLFLQEYVLFKESQHFCVFDSRGFSMSDATECLDLTKKWMTNGVRHGEAVPRSSDSATLKEALEGRGRQCQAEWSIKRRVDFVIFVVNAFSVYNMSERRDVLGLRNLAVLFKSPFLTFKDDVPVVVMTHGDKLSPEDRIYTRIFLGELFGVSPVDQVFDISCFTERAVLNGDVDEVNDIELLNMLKFALERADKNLPYKTRAALIPSQMWSVLVDKWNGIDVWRFSFVVTMLSLFLLLTILIIYVGRSHHGDKHFRHMMLKKLRHLCRH